MFPRHTRSALRLVPAGLLTVVGLATLPSTAANPPPDVALRTPPLDHVPGVILVGLIDGAPAAAVAEAAQRLGASEIASYPDIGVECWRLVAGIDVEHATELLSRAPYRDAIEYAEPNYLIGLRGFTDDLARGELWNLHNVGQSGGTIDADIDAPEAWDVVTGSPDVVVAVIDTGVEYTHDDLAAHAWTNPGEIPDNGVDDDGNGFVDDVHGWDFECDDNDPMDGDGHGSHVAGIVGAVGNNGLGVVGVCRSITLMPVQCLSGRTGLGTTQDAIDAIQYAASFEDAFGNKIVRVIAAAWGSLKRSRSLERAIEASGALYVAPAGNNGDSEREYPSGSDLESIICVAATDHDDALSSSSSYGADWVDLGAPGVDVLSCERHDRYGLRSGTSMAVPHVAGTAALLLAQHPEWAIAQVKTQILDTVDPIPALQGLTVTGGRLNAMRAVGGMPLPPDGVAPAPVLDLSADAGATTHESITLTWTATGDDGPTGTAYLYDLRHAETPIDEASWAAATVVGGEPLPRPVGSAEAFTVEGLAASTTYYLALTVTDEVGNLSLLSNVVAETTAPPPPPQWTIEVIDTGDNLATYLGLDFDVLGRPGIAYSDYANGWVKFAHWNGAAWDIEVIDESQYAGVDFAYDPLTGEPTASYGWGKLYFATRSGGAWSRDVVERRNAANDVTSLVYDHAGRAAISYRAGRDPSLKLARWNGSAWDKEIVDGAPARYSALVFDGDGNPAIAYSDILGGGNAFNTLKVARWTGFVWEIDVVDSGPDGYGVHAAIALDPSTGDLGVVHKGAGQVRFFRRTGGTWVGPEIFDDTTIYLWACALIFGNDGTAYVVYEGSERPLQMAVRDPGTGAWSIEAIDPGSAPFHLSLKWDHEGRLAVAYGGVGDTLRLARRIGSAAPARDGECPDVNGDRVVDIADLRAVLAAWGRRVGREDVNGDGVVSALDLIEMLSAWGACRA